jgi:hypothetical protein
MADDAVRERLRRKVVYAPGDRAEQLVGIAGSLARFGYLLPEEHECGPDEFCPDLEKAVRLFQEFAGLPRTGVVDVGTLKLLRAKRCGIADVTPEQARAGSLGSEGNESSDPFVFIFNSAPWPRYDLTYRVYNRTSDIGGDTEVAIVDQAFGVWQAVSPLRFTRVGTGGDILVGWETGAHGDGSAFDGVGNVVAHGFYPETGRLHFDDAESWSATGGNVDLLDVAIHEIGHCLGLGHSREHASIMWPFVQNGLHTLSEFDIRAILSLYPWLAGTADRAGVAHVWAFAGGTGSAVIDLGAVRNFLAWGEVTFVDSLARFDRDNAVAFDIFTVDGDHPMRAGFNGDHLGTEGAPSNLFAGAVRGRGRHVQFRLSTFHSSDLEAYGVGNVVVLD